MVRANNQSAKQVQSSSSSNQCAELICWQTLVGVPTKHRSAHWTPTALRVVIASSTKLFGIWSMGMYFLISRVSTLYIVIKTDFHHLCQCIWAMAISRHNPYSQSVKSTRVGQALLEQSQKPHSQMEVWLLDLDKIKKKVKGSIFKHKGKQ